MLYDYDALDKDDEIGEAKLAVADLKNQEEKDVWLDIKEMTPDGPSQHKVSLVCDMWCGKFARLKILASPRQVAWRAGQTGDLMRDHTSLWTGVLAV